MSWEKGCRRVLSDEGWCRLWKSLDRANGVVETSGARRRTSEYRAGETVGRVGWC
jgi:hypothetical protein